MQISKQISVSLVNKPGRLANILSALSKEKIHCLALSVMNAGDRGTLRIVPDDLDAAAEVLEKLDIRHEVADVLLMPVPSHNGAMSKLCERLGAEHLNIDYVYCSGGPRGNMAVIKVNDLAKAERVLGESVAAVVRRKLPGRRPVHAR